MKSYSQLVVLGSLGQSMFSGLTVLPGPHSLLMGPAWVGKAVTIIPVAIMARIILFFISFSWLLGSKTQVNNQASA
ncbi:hypothetical protein [Marinicella meishanensis]|uniref:hypothetical protein n=1 Tax=Marinicella meishanensis TaxID=2873263 RepID=UPI001CBED280|nr:hypothetical protein [Marinicella sp. NBU2979]